MGINWNTSFLVKSLLKNRKLIETVLWPINMLPMTEQTVNCQKCLYCVNSFFLLFSGTMMILSGVFYILKTFKTLADKRRKTLAQTPSYDK